MRKLMNILILITIIAGCSQTYTPEIYEHYTKTTPIVISERVGETIDSEEREHYDLFQGIEDFKSAQIFDIWDPRGGGYVAVIQTESQTFEAVNRDPKAIQIFTYYIENYERIKETPDARWEFEDKWLVMGYDALGQPITAHEIDRVKKNTNMIGFGIATAVLSLPVNLTLGCCAGYGGGH